MTSCKGMGAIWNMEPIKESRENPELSFFGFVTQVFLVYNPGVT